MLVHNPVIARPSAASFPVRVPHSCGLGAANDPPRPHECGTLAPETPEATRGNLVWGENSLWTTFSSLVKFFLDFLWGLCDTQTTQVTHGVACVK
jgi:hypothetical protein